MSTWNQTVSSFGGNIKNFPLSSIFQIIEIGGKSGSLFVTNFPKAATIIFYKGKVIQALSSTRRSSLGELLIENGLLDQEKLAHVLKVQKESNHSQAMGEICVQNGFLEEKDLARTLRTQLEQIVTQILEWGEGVFSFYSNESHIDETQIKDVDMEGEGFSIGRVLQTILIEKERRSEPRLHLELKVDFEVDGTQNRGISRDISRNGIFIRSNYEPKLEHRVSLSIWIPSYEHPRGAIGRVVRIENQNPETRGFGVEFVSIDPQVVEALSKLSMGQDISGSEEDSL